MNGPKPKGCSTSPSTSSSNASAAASRRDVRAPSNQHCRMPLRDDRRVRESRREFQWPAPRRHSLFLAASRPYGNKLAIDPVGRHPSVDSATVIADLEPRTLDGLHKMKVLRAIDLAQHN